jgi:hypothetical protein
MSEQLQQQFDRMFAGVAAPPCGPPPGAFLRAVRWRRRQRRMVHAGLALAVVMLAGMPVLLVWPGAESGSPPAGGSPVVDLGRPDAAPVIMPTAYALLQLNREFDVDHVVLPEEPGWETGESAGPARLHHNHREFQEALLR